jgi:hypothetical protein
MSIGKYHYRYIKQFMKNDLSNIKIINGVPKVVFIFWFSHKDYIPNFTTRRFNSLKSLIENIKVPVIIITNENYKNWEIKENPIHEGFKYLSGNHKSDYLRAYLLCYYGGGYHDIKWREKSWENEWDKFIDPNVWLIGRRELNENCIGYNPENNEEYIQKEFNKLITMGWVISTPKNEYIQTLLNKINKKLDDKIEILKLKSAPNPRCGIGNGCDKNEYPFRWLELMGEIFHPLLLNYIEHINYTLPDILYKTYK